jgi:hypothetical protein
LAGTQHRRSASSSTSWRQAWFTRCTRGEARCLPLPLPLPLPWTHGSRTTGEWCHHPPTAPPRESGRSTTCRTLLLRDHDDLVHLAVSGPGALPSVISLSLFRRLDAHKLPWQTPRPELPGGRDRRRSGDLTLFRSDLASCRNGWPTMENARRPSSEAIFLSAFSRSLRLAIARCFAFTRARQGHES